MLHTIKHGLDLPILGIPEQIIYDGPLINSVGILGRDFIELKPSMQIQVGDRVKLGQTLFTDKTYPSIRYTAPGAGIISAINRGKKRILQSVVIELAGNEEITFSAYASKYLTQLTRGQILDNLLMSGLWTAIRTRPYSKVPNPASVPNSLFINAMDTNPLALKPETMLAEQAESFVDGMTVLAKLTDGKLFLCKKLDATIPISSNISNLVIAEFTGPHPAGLPGTHIHYLDPVSANKFVWHIGYQDVVAIGKLFTTGKLWTERVVALAGPAVKQPRLLRTRLGANIATLTNGEITDNIEARIISGSVLSGRHAMDWAQYLGRYHTQISVIREERERRFFGWFDSGIDRYSHLNVLISKFFGSQHQFALTTSQNGSPRAFIPIESFSSVMPLDILPTMLLRAIMVGDTDRAVELGCVELDEEDLALCTYVCPSKYEYGAALRATLNQIEIESPF